MLYPFHFHMRVSTPLAASATAVSDATADIIEVPFLVIMAECRSGRRAVNQDDAGERNACCAAVDAAAEMDTRHASAPIILADPAIALPRILFWQICCEDINRMRWVSGALQAVHTAVRHTQQRAELMMPVSLCCSFRARGVWPTHQATHVRRSRTRPC
ncbi:unnamed protein product [Ectocarpus sp. 13 AM-2016]